MRPVGADQIRFFIGLAGGRDRILVSSHQRRRLAPKAGDHQVLVEREGRKIGQVAVEAQTCVGFGPKRRMVEYFRLPPHRIAPVSQAAAQREREFLGEGMAGPQRAADGWRPGDSGYGSHLVLQVGPQGLWTFAI